MNTSLPQFLTLEQRVWIVEGLEKFVEILQEDYIDLSDFLNRAIREIVTYMKVEQGSIYMINKTNTEKAHFERAASYPKGVFNPPDGEEVSAENLVIIPLKLKARELGVLEIVSHEIFEQHHFLLIERFGEELSYILGFQGVSATPNS